jgi:hypothetical protein
MQAEIAACRPALAAGGKGQISEPTLWSDQIETGPAYHAIPESHMKAPILMLKWHIPKYLGLPYFLRRRNGESLA